MARLAGESGERNRLDIDDGLAAESAAELGGMNAQVAGFHAEQPHRERAHDEVTLIRCPEFCLAVGVEAREA